MSTRVPPSDLSAEEACLSAALLSSNAADELVELITPGEFFAVAHRRIFEAILELRLEHQPADIVSVAGVLRTKELLHGVGGSPALAKLADATPSIANVATHAAIVRKWARVRLAITTFQNCAIEGYGDVGDVDTWLNQCEARVFKACASDSADRESVATYGEALTEAYDLVRSAYKGGTQLVGRSTGFSCLDEHLGGLAAGDLVYLAGRPGQGKTSLAMQIAEAIAAQRTIVPFFSLEMNRQQLALRSLARLSSVPLRALRRGRIDTREQWDRLAETITRQARVPLIVDDGEELSPMRLRRRIRRHVAAMRSQHGELPLGAVFVDYVQLMKGDVQRQGRPNANTRNEELSEISKDLKRIGKEFGCPVIALSALARPQRGTAVKPPELHDLRDSGALEFDADIVLAIHREDEYVDPAKRTGLADIIALKARNAGSGKFTVHFDGRVTAFYESQGSLPLREE